MRFRACIIRAASLAAACVLFVSGHGNAVPAGSQNGNDLAAKVTIRRDTFGVPHILGETEEAAHFGLGYAMAEDHLLELARDPPEVHFFGIDTWKGLEWIEDIRNRGTRTERVFIQS